MDVPSNAVSDSLDEELNEALEDPTATGKQSLRLKRIEEYEEACLERTDPYAAMVGASKMERIVLKQSIAMLDALNVELDKSAGNLRKLAHSKPRKRVRRSARVGR